MDERVCIKYYDIVVRQFIPFPLSLLPFNSGDGVSLKINENKKKTSVGRGCCKCFFNQ